MDHSDAQFLPEVWTLYGIGVAVILLRFATRIKTVGFKGFQGDDYFSILTLACYTIDAATVHIIFGTGTNVEASVMQETRTLSKEEVAMFEFGSKEQLAAWYSYTALIWSMKGSMLFFFHRLTIGLWQHKYIKPLGIVCAISYLAVLMTLTFGCFPTRRNWQVVPDPGQQCTLKLQNFLVTVILNVITDALILSIPVPLLWALRIPLKRKLIISLLLCSGLFVITAAIVRVALTLDRNPSATNINRWGVRETIVGIITINAPILRPMFTSHFWEIGTWKDASLSHGISHNLEGRTEFGSGSTSGGRGFELSSSGNHILDGKDKGWGRDLEGGKTEKGMAKHKRGKSSTTLVGIGSRSAESLQHIIQAKREDGKDGRGLEVNVVTTFRVESERVDTSGFDGFEVEQREEDWQRRSGSFMSARRK